MNNLILIKGTLEVKARGFWFTAGGEKGSFGYYPHLKNLLRQPVYPDTQIHGDLRMAAAWLLERGYGDEQNGYYKELFKIIFGHGGIKKENYNTEIPVRSMLYPSDLELSGTSQQVWSDKRFVVKPRIEINDETRTVKKHMLVDLEMAWLDGLTLESPLYLGYFKNEEKAKHAWEFLGEAVCLLSGFGAFRSRGYGRGEIKISEWDKVDKICFEGVNQNQVTSTEKAMPYFLKSSTNMRNKPIEVGRTQLIDSLYCITNTQLRSWFVNIYHDIYNEWPTLDEIKTIHFPTLYPCPETNIYTYPAPMTTLKFDDGTYKDMWGIERKNNDPDTESAGEAGSDATRLKQKSITAHEFITQAPKVFTLKTEIRMRNALGMDFQSGESGLFAQELIHAGTVFGGAIVCESPDSEFTKKALHILKNAEPLIKGTVFAIDKQNSDGPKAEAGNPSLLIDPLSGDKMIAIVNNLAALGGAIENKGDCVRLITIRGYNTTLKRPRRNRIAIAPGAIIKESIIGKTVSWSGFGNEFYALLPKEAKPPQSSGKIPDKPPNHIVIQQNVEKLASLEEVLKDKLTSAQAGFLRGFLNPAMTKAAAELILNHRAEKHSNKKDILLATLYTEMAVLTKNNDMGGLKYYVRCVLDKLAAQKVENKLKPPVKGGHKKS